MTNRLKNSAAIIVFLMLTACSDNAPDTSEQIASENKFQNVSEQNITQTAVQAIPEYKIIEDEVKRNIKRTVEVELSSRTDKETLRDLAEEIYALSNAEVERTFIGYRIASEDKNQAFWAKTDYNPDLNINILGKNATDYEMIKNTAMPEGEILGSWMVGDGIDYRTTAYTKDGKTYMQIVADTNGKSSDRVYNLSQSDKGIKLQGEDSDDQDGYFIINKKGNLEFWNEENGNYYTTSQKV